MSPKRLTKQLQPTAGPGAMIRSQHIYEVRPRKDHRGFDLISDALPFGRVVVRRTERNQ